jgi:hypothetical protein
MSFLPRRFASVLCCAFAVFLAHTPHAEAAAPDISIAWDANAEPDVIGYVVQWGPSTAPYVNAVDVGNVTGWTLTNPTAGTTYAFRVVAYNRAGEYSDPSAAVNGTAAATTTPAPNPAASRPALAVDTPASSATLAANFVVAGWALDLGATVGTGIDQVDVWAYPNPGSGAAAVFLGTATYGVSRQDLVPYVGAQFAASGYSLQVRNVAAGTYDLAVFAHSAVAGTYNAVKTARVSVVAAGSLPQMVVDAPGKSATVPTTFTIGGWALDRGAASGAGVNAVHVWAYPLNGGAPVFVGAAATGGARPDVAGFLGQQFLNCGYSVNGKLAVGDYTLAVFAQSTVTGSFNNVTTLPISVR